MQYTTEAKAPVDRVATLVGQAPACPRHTRETLRIQQRLERAELEHLREVVAAQGAQIEQLQHDLTCAEDQAIFWSREHDNLQDHLANNTADGRVIGLTKSGELLVVEMGRSA